MIQAFLAAALLMAVTAGFTGVTWQWRSAEVARRTAETATLETKQAQTAEQIARKHAESHAEALREGQERLKNALRLVDRGRVETEAKHWDHAARAYTGSIPRDSNSSQTIRWFVWRLVAAALFTSSRLDA